jgi:multiple sugar transport system substrate-binding protein
MTHRTITRRELLAKGAAAGAGSLLLNGMYKTGLASAATGLRAGSVNPIKAHLTLYNWGTPVDKQIWTAAIARFNKLFPNVTTTDNIVPVTSWGDYADKLKVLIAGNAAPDLINVGIEGFRLLQSKNFVSPVDSYLGKSPQLTSDIRPKLLSPGAINGKTYYIPHLYETMVIFYNTKMFAKAGIPRPSANWTWNDFLAIAQHLTTGSGANKVYGYGHAYADFQLEPWFYTNSTSQLTADLTRSNLTDPKFIESVTFIHDLVNKYRVAPNPVGYNENDEFAAGKVAMVGGGHYVLQTLDAAHFHDYDIVPWPKKRVSATVFGVAGWGISPTCQVPAVAWELIKEFSSPQTEIDKAKAGVNEPVSTAALNSAAFLAEPKHARLFVDVLANATFNGYAPVKYDDKERIFMQYMGLVMSGSMSPAAAMKAADSQLNAIL